VLNYLSFALCASTVGLWRLRGMRFDAIFVYEPSPITVGVPAVLLRRVKDAQVAFWVLDLWPETLEAIGAVRSRRVLRAVGALVAFIYERCDLVLAQSRSFIPHIRRYCADAGRIAYFPSWAEAVYDMDGVEPAAEVPVRPGVFNVMFAGNIGDAQDFPAILDAAQRLRHQPGIRWLIVGDGRTAGWVRDEVVRRGLEQTVSLLGRYPVERMPSFYKHADALLVSLKSEPIFSMTIPGKLQSYLAAGIPVVAMLDGEGARVVERASAGLVCAAGDSVGLAAAVSRLAAMPEAERRRMGANGLRLSAEEFDRDTLIRRLEGWLASIARRERIVSVEPERR
jgi:colanic acid biosynthesis glycosyl transferase WcaI